MKILIFFLGFLFLFSCGKKRTIVITAKNGVTGQPYAGLEYIVGSAVVGSDNGVGTRTEESGFLNESGEAVVTLREKRNRRYVVRVVEPENYCYSNYTNIFFDSPGDEDGHFNFVFAECAYLMQNVNNINCQGGGDYMILYTKNQVNSLGVTGWEFFGCNGYVGNHYSNVPIGKYYFQWEVTRNNITNTYYDTIYLSPGEYRTYDINY